MDKILFNKYYSEKTELKIDWKMTEISSNRIQYIDAMRGFTMLLVVMAHVSLFTLKVHGFSYNTLLEEFRMPLFFFVSGFVFFKKEKKWNVNESFFFLKRKIFVQIISPLLFLFIYVYTNNISFMDALYAPMKEGFWFTFTLFEYFVFYIIIQWILRFLKWQGFLEDFFVVFVGLVLFYVIPCFFTTRNVERDMWAFLGVLTWNRFLFFVIGTRIRKYFHLFEELLDTSYFITVCIVVFVSFNIFPFFMNISGTIYLLSVSLSGIFIVFAFFRSKSESLNSNTFFGTIFQYVGRRTLDIYLLHYFFIHEDAKLISPNVSSVNSPFFEFICCFIIAILVIFLCLLISNVIRLSPILGYYLFGQTHKNNIKL